MNGSATACQLGNGVAIVAFLASIGKYPEKLMHLTSNIVMLHCFVSFQVFSSENTSLSKCPALNQENILYWQIYRSQVLLKL